jgi:hypothetical protein
VKKQHNLTKIPLQYVEKTSKKFSPKSFIPRFKEISEYQIKFSLRNIFDKYNLEEIMKGHYGYGLDENGLDANEIGVAMELYRDRNRNINKMDNSKINSIPLPLKQPTNR